MASADPFATSEPSQTTFAAPSEHAEAFAGAKAEWTPASALVSVRVPIGGKSTIPSDTIKTALLATIGRKAGESVVSTRAYTIVGEQSCNPTGARVGIDVVRTTAHCV